MGATKATAASSSFFRCKPARSPPPIDLFFLSFVQNSKNESQQNRLAARTPQRAARVVVVKAADKASVSCFEFEVSRGEETRAENEERQNKRRPQTEEEESLTISRRNFSFYRKQKRKNRSSPTSAPSSPSSSALSSRRLVLRKKGFNERVSGEKGETREES